MPDPRTYHFRLPRYQGPPVAEPPHTWYPGVTAHQIPSTSDRRQHGGGQVRAFVIHATAGWSSADAMSLMFAHKASWHWLVPDEDEPQHGRIVWACAPERRAAWHVLNSQSHPDVNNGTRFVNYWSLGVEIVNRQRQADAFSDWQIRQAAALVRYAWSKYPTLVDVVSHAKLDPTRRRDPGAHFAWDTFQSLVLEPPESERAIASVAAPAVEPSLRVVSTSGEVIDCDARFLDGAAVVEARPLIEALGFSVQWQEGPPPTLKVTRGRRRRASSRKRRQGGVRYEDGPP